MNGNPMNCAMLDDRLADFLEGELAVPERRALEAHLASCLRCASLVRDLERIRADAAALAPLVPSRDLWPGIEARIEAPVRPLGTAPGAAARGSWHRVRFAAIAAGLVAVTAGITYTLTKTTSAGNPEVAQEQPVGRGPSERTLATPAGTDSSSAGADSAIDTQLATGPERGGVDGSGVAQNPGPSAQPVRSAPAGVSRSQEIDRLREIFAQNKYRLDPRTAAIIEANLKVIDEAIAQSRAALAEDPASGFLNQQLSLTLEKKLELLRTAARLPNRT